MEIVWIAIVVAFASLLKGVTGFGFGIIVMPLLMNWFYPKELIPVIAFCNLISSLLIVFQKKEVNLLPKKSWVLIVSGGLSTIPGVVALNYISDSGLYKTISVIFIVLSQLSYKNISSDKKPTGFTYVTAGSVVGFLTGWISASGPSLALFLNHAKISKQEFREIFAWFSVITSPLAIIGYWKINLITEQSLEMTLLFVPLILMGTIIGKRLIAVIPASVFKYITIGLTLLASIILLLRDI